MDADLNGGGAGRPVLLGVTERLEFVDAPGHAADLKRYRARGYGMKDTRIAIRLGRPQRPSRCILHQLPA